MKEIYICIKFFLMMWDPLMSSLSLFYMNQMQIIALKRRSPPEFDNSVEVAKRRNTDDLKDLNEYAEESFNDDDQDFDECENEEIAENFNGDNDDDQDFDGCENEETSDDICEQVKLKNSQIFLT